MESFADLDLAPLLVEALAAEGVEVPTPLQEAAIPVLRRGNNLLAAAGPGAGVLVAWGAPLLERLAESEAEEGGFPRVVILTPTRERALRSAESLARLAQMTGHAVAALGSAWALPRRAHVLFSTPSDLLGEVRGSRVKLDAVESVVVDGASAMEGLELLDDADTLLELIPAEAQRVVVSLPVSDAVESLVERHVRRAVTLPPRPAVSGDADAPPHRGTVRYRVASRPPEEETLAVVASLLESGEHRHVMVFFRSEDAAADVGDFLTLHGYAAGAPGDDSVPVWLAAEEKASRRALEATDDPAAVATVSHDVPSGPDALDRRHGAGGESRVLVHSRELPHLEDVARRTGYDLEPDSSDRPPRVARALARIEEALVDILENGDVAPWYLTLEPLFERYDPAEVAAAAVALLRRRPADAVAPAPGRAAAGADEGTPAPSRGTAWVRLFVGVGKKDGAGPGDLLGAVTGEAGVEGERVGKIEIRDTFSILEVDQEVAEKVIRAVNGTTIRGRSARVDYDRGPGPRTGGSRRSGSGPRTS